MTDTDKENAAVAGDAPTPTKKISHADRQRSVLPVLEQLFSIYPKLFGADFLPLKLGVFQEILAANPDVFKKDSLRAALGVHTRSTRYLHAVASGKWRHDLNGLAVEAVAPEHIVAAIGELYRRRQARQKADLRPQAVQQMVSAVEGSGLSCAEFELRVHSSDEATAGLLKEALDLFRQMQARHAATARAYTASGKTVEEFADMYGMDPADVTLALERSARS